MDGCAHEYRLLKINEIQEYFEKERDKRIALSNEYRRGVRVLSLINVALVLVAMGLGASGIAVLATIVAIPIAASLGGIIALAAAPLILVGDQVNNKLSLKKEKHEQIKTHAEAKIMRQKWLVHSEWSDLCKLTQG